MLGDKTTKCCGCGMDDSRRLSTHVIGNGEGRQLGGQASQERNNLMQDRNRCTHRQQSSDSTVKGHVVLRVLYVVTLESMLSLQSKVLASHITAATVSDTVSRLPGCAEQTCDAASAHTQQKEDPLELLQLPEADCLILDTALTVKTPEKLGLYSGPRRSIGTQSLRSSICMIIMRTKRWIFFDGRRSETCLWMAMFASFPRTLLISFCQRGR